MSLYYLNENADNNNIITTHLVLECDNYIILYYITNIELYEWAC